MGQSEKQMRETEAAHPKNQKELIKEIARLVERKDHDYGTCVDAMSLASVATFNYVAHRLGVSGPGFQASCLDILRRTRMMRGSFILLKAEDLLYPQYDLHKRLDEAIAGWRPWLKKEAKKLLAKNRKKGSCAPAVRFHWQRLAK